MKIKLKNSSQVSVGGQLPGAEFRVDAIDTETPKSNFWRERLKDADGITLVKETTKAPVKETKRETLTLNSDSKSASPKTQTKKEEAA